MSLGTDTNHVTFFNYKIRVMIAQHTKEPVLYVILLLQLCSYRCLKAVGARWFTAGCLRPSAPKSQHICKPDTGL
jgi:hypothetical protein